MIHQRTLRQSIKAAGIGLHTGKHINMEIHPAPEDTGIVFRRTDMDPVIEIKASALNVNRTVLSTEISHSGVSVCTIEHLVSAFAGMSIDNAYIDVDQQEVPVMDGSASSYVFLLQSAGTREQNKPKKYIRILKRTVYQQDDKMGEFLPYEGYRIHCAIHFSHPYFKDKDYEISLDFSGTSFVKEISRARTFGFLKDIHELQKNNLALGGNMNNAVVLGDTDILNAEGLRHPKELVLHKALDAIGDLYLIGYNIIGEFRGYKSGHHINNQLIRKLLENQDNFRIEEFQDIQELPPNYRRLQSDLDHVDKQSHVASPG